jgi:CheY-like chemotaxis protein
MIWWCSFSRPWAGTGERIIFVRALRLKRSHGFKFYHSTLAIINISVQITLLVNFNFKQTYKYIQMIHYPGVGFVIIKDLAFMSEKAFSSGCILIVEDDESNRKVTFAMLKHLGYRADAVSNGREALLALKRQPYDIILMNLSMPDMDGLEATRLIRLSCPSTHQPTIIALTACILPNSREICLDAGMNDFMPKPFKMNELAMILTKHMRILERQTAFMRLHEEVSKTLDSLPKRGKIILPFKQNHYLKN